MNYSAKAFERSLPGDSTEIIGNVQHSLTLYSIDETHEKYLYLTKHPNKIEYIDLSKFPHKLPRNEVRMKNFETDHEFNTTPLKNLPFCERIIKGIPSGLISEKRLEQCLHEVLGEIDDAISFLKMELTLARNDPKKYLQNQKNSVVELVRYLIQAKEYTLGDLEMF